jgi:hypothetical protein
MNFAALPQGDRAFRTYWAWIDEITKVIPADASPNTMARIMRRRSDLKRQWLVACANMQHPGVRL